MEMMCSKLGIGLNIESFKQHRVVPFLSGIYLWFVVFPTLWCPLFPSPHIASTHACSLPSCPSPSHIVTWSREYLLVLPSWEGRPGPGQQTAFKPTHSPPVALSKQKKTFCMKDATNSSLKEKRKKGIAETAQEFSVRKSKNRFRFWETAHKTNRNPFIQCRH